MIQQLLKRFLGTPEELARQVQMGGLVRTARLVSNVVGEPPPAPDLFPQWLEEVLAMAAGRMCAYDDERLPAAAECGAMETAKEFLAGMPAETRVEFQSLLVLLEMSPFVFGPKRRRFTKLDGPHRDAVLRGWESSSLLPMRTGFRALKSVVMMGYWSRPDTWPAIGYSIHDNPGVPQPQKQLWKQREEET